MPKSTRNPAAEQTQCEIRPIGRMKKQSNKSEDFGLTEIDYVISNAKLSRHNALLDIFEDNEAVVRMIIKGKSDNEARIPNPRSCA